MAKKKKADDDLPDQPANKKSKSTGTRKAVKSTEPAPTTSAPNKASATAPDQDASPPVPSKKTNLTLKLNQINKAPTKKTSADGSPSRGAITERELEWDVPRISAGIYPFNPVSPVDDSFFTTIRNYQQPEAQRNIPIGLPNPGRHFYCYQNAVVTALLNSKRFVAYLRGWHMARESQSTFDKDTTYIAAHLANIAALMNDDNCSSKEVAEGMESFRNAVLFPPTVNHSSTNSSLRPGFVSQTWRERGLPLGETNKHTQCDAQELLNWLIESLSEQLAATDYSAESHFDNFSLLRRTERICCIQCKWPVKRRTHRRDPSRVFFISMSDMISSMSDGVRTAAARGLNIITMGECISKALLQPLNDEWRCSRCGQTGDGDKNSKLFKLQTGPEMLFICLQRTGWTPQGVSTKLLEQVSLEEELDISPWLEPHAFGPKASIKYKLVAIVSHEGRALLSGHYVSYVRGSKDSDQWYEIDNEEVAAIDFPQISDTLSYSDAGFKRITTWKARRTPYLLMYEKIYDTEVVDPGRRPMNPQDTVDTPKDVRPKYWIDELDAGQLPSPVADHDGGQGLAKTNQNDAPAPDGGKQKASKPADNVVADGSVDASTQPSPPKQPPSDPTKDETVSNGAQTVAGPVKRQQKRIFISGPREDVNAGPAELEVQVKIGRTTLKLPLFVLSGFDKNIRRDISVKANIKVSNGVSSADAIPVTDKSVSLDISELMTDKITGELRQWESRWKPS